MNAYISELKELLKGLHKRLRQDEDPAERDLARVVFASKLLDISEFRFFSLAYADWYGHEIHENRLEQVFADYMFEDCVPHWVRHFTRKVITSFSENRLDPGHYKAADPDIPKNKRAEGIGYLVILSLVITAFCTGLIYQAPLY